MLRSESLLAARQSSGLLAADKGLLLDPVGYIVESASLLTSFGAGLLDDALGLVGTPQIFDLTAPGPIYGGLPVIARIPWLLAASSGGAALGTMQVELLADGAVIATGQGAPRDLSAAAVNSEYVEIISLIPGTSGTMISTSGTFGLRVTPIVTTASGVGATTYEPQLRHDPQTPDNQLVFELQAAELADKVAS